MQKLAFALITSITLFSFSVFAQTGTIRGTVIDDATGEPMIGVTVVIEGTTTGAATDLDGAFSIKIAPGTYNVQASFISYQSVTVSDVVVKSDDITLLGTIRMGEAVEQLAEVVVTAEAIRTSEAAILTVKRKSANLLDGISSETFSRIGDGDAAGAIKRVPGVSVQGGQYVFVRGLGDRYTKTILNGLEIPGLDPDRNAIQIDIFPTNLIGNIIVYKNFTPDLSADFVGGTVDLELKDFPEEKILSFSVSAEYNNEMHLRDNYINYQGGGTDFLGFDDGTRDLPYDPQASGLLPAASSRDPQLTEIIRRFEPNMGVEQQTSPMNIGLSFTAGNQINKNDVTLGYNAALNYSNRTQFFENSVDAAFIRSNDPTIDQLQPNVRFDGPLGVNDVQLSGLIGGSLKTNNSKFNITALHIQNGTSTAARRTAVRTGRGNSNTSIVDGLEYTERSLTNLAARGEHFLEGPGLELEWKANTTFAVIDDKDVRITPFTIDEGVVEINPNEGGNPQRIWRLLDEQNYVGKIDLTKAFQFRDLDSKVKFGVSNIYKTRQFELPTFDLFLRGNLATDLDGNPDNLLLPENIVSEDNNFNGTTITANIAERGGRLINTNSYEGRINILGAYLMSELGLTEKLKTILGVRVEKYDQYYTGTNSAGLSGDPEGVFDDEKVLDSFEFFPSVSLIYNVIENSNLRASYSRTIARPSFKEKSTVEIQDVKTGRTFIGNIDLIETNINNYDLRWEYFLSRGQTISVGAFYKTFDNPIELVRQPADPTNFRPQNVGDAEIIGVEFELRKNLDFISSTFKDFQFVTNVTFTESTIDIDEEELEGRENGLREGQELENERDFLGQAPLLINAGLNYTNFKLGLESGLSFNRQSRTLAVVGVNRSPDTFDVPFNSLNFNISKTFGVEGKNKIGLRITNILDDDRERIFRSFDSADFIETSRDPGRGFRVKYSRTF